jgi:SAM-dependent methyltransferase
VTRAAEWDRLDAAAYDVAVCNLAVHDLADVEPLFRSLPRALRPSGRLVLGLVHPAPLLRRGVRPHVPTPRLAAPDQPSPHVEVTRPLPDLWGLANAAGWRVETVVEVPPGEPTVALAVLSPPLRR